MSDELATQIAKRFIQRRNVKAIQFANGAYSPDTFIPERAKEPIGLRPQYAPLGFKMQHLRDHLAGIQSYGHYLIDEDNICRLFAFDIDLEKEGTWVDLNETAFPLYKANPREDWKNRAHPGRKWWKLQMRQLSHKFVAFMVKEANLPCAVAYSGGKGVHVYGFTGPMPAQEVYEMAHIVIDGIGEFQAIRGKNFFKHVDDNPTSGYGNFSIEVFPKQENLDGKDLGNLMRLPMGRNLKSKDPTFFVDMNAPLADLRPVKDPVRTLALGDPFRD